MNYTKLKHASDKISDFDFGKFQNQKIENTLVDVEKLWSEKNKMNNKFVPEKYSEFGRYNSLTNKERNNLIQQERMKKNVEMFNNHK